MRPGPTLDKGASADAARHSIDDPVRPAAVAEVTRLPVTAIVYSHNHADHIIGTAEILAAARAADVKNVRVIASTQTDTKMKLLQTSLPAPTETVAWPNGSFEFEGLTVRLNGFTRAAHTDDAAALLLVQEKVVHLCR